MEGEPRLSHAINFCRDWVLALLLSLTMCINDEFAMAGYARARGSAMPDGDKGLVHADHAHSAEQSSSSSWAISAWRMALAMQDIKCGSPTSDSDRRDRLMYLTFRCATVNL